MRIALFGGSFDPPHRGHLAVAAAAADRFSVDRILFAPAGRQPLKSEADASWPDRCAMTMLACDQDPRFELSALDAPRADEKPNYTVDTLRQLQKSMPEAHIFNLAGADSFHSLARWHQPQTLLDLCEWIVVSRPGFSLSDPEGITLTAAQRSRIHLLDSLHEDVAASNLRERLRHGDPCTDLLVPAVSRFIRHHHLYLATEN
jgi:nicotinate-nucleotide adenylyltransferase